MHFISNFVLSVLAASAFEPVVLSAPVNGTAQYGESALSSTASPVASLNNKRASPFGYRPSATPGTGAAVAFAGPYGASNSTQASPEASGAGHPVQSLGVWKRGEQAGAAAGSGISSTSFQAPGPSPVAQASTPSTAAQVSGAGASATQAALPTPGTVGTTTQKIATPSSSKAILTKSPQYPTTSASSKGHGTQFPTQVPPAAPASVQYLI